MLTNVFQRRRFLTVLALLFTILSCFLRYLYNHTHCRAPKHIKGGNSSNSRKKSRSSSASETSSTYRSGHKKHTSRLNAALPTIFILIGISGSGKSQWSTQYIERVRKSAKVVNSEKIRMELTGSVTDYNFEEEVVAAILKDVAAHLRKKRTIIVDCSHNLRHEFRAQVLSLTSLSEYNCVAKLFPMKPLFARSRLEKDVLEGRRTVIADAVELEAQEAQFLASLDNVRPEGWIVDP